MTYECIEGLMLAFWFRLGMPCRFETFASAAILPADMAVELAVVEGWLGLVAMPEMEAA